MMLPELRLVPLPLHASSVFTCWVFLVPGVRVSVGAIVSHFSAVVRVFLNRPQSVLVALFCPSLPWSGCVRWESASCDINIATYLVLQAPISVTLIS